jgi:CsoR family transcriptional regulator, copper-sensing transcriptional repressor
MPPYPLFSKTKLFKVKNSVYVTKMAHSRHVHDPAEKRSLEIRLRKVIGQLKSVEQMVEEDRDCVDILTQIVSARKALKSFAEVVIHQHAHECIERASDPREGQKRLRELLTVLQRYVE